MTALPPPTTAAEPLQKWNSPRSNIPRVGACFFSFVVMGSNDAAYGPLIPYIQEYYGLSYTIVSLLFLSPFVGYTAAALLNNHVHLKFGQRGVAFFTGIAHLVAYIIIATHPPYPVLVVAFVFAGLGNGLADAAWNAWIGNMTNANEILGLLHGLYGLGAVLAPLIATTLITKAGTGWWYYYYIMIGMASLELVSTTYTFWSATGDMTATTTDEAVASIQKKKKKSGGLRHALLHRPGARVTWLCAIFLLGYVGVEVALGGWIVEFMIQVRQGEAFASGMAAMGFWLGITVGRVILGFVTPRIGERLAITIYLPIAIGLQILFWLVPQFIVSTVAVGLVGFFLGPLFPGVIVVMSKLLPRSLHVSAIGFAAAFGGSGAAILPFAVGALAQAKGVQVLQPFIVALLAVIMGLWLLLPRVNKKKE
ncbi:major facilitator superfamily domain-containing protein [Microdochium bolleyi]|uniref:Major facilitator superfamily domain-containing protein n=1 Tax=Microdochium bolleyi TaxID=196109 RepID=A0A136IU77_9PEZI|nr:major facilitator superfamily domain-containing protein [Microdochium bolleyi]